MNAKHLILGMLTLPLASQANAIVLVTEQFAIVVAERCPEGDVACSSVVYTGVNRKTGETLTLKGKAWVRMCADKVTPCEHLGWEFKNGGFTYRVHEAPPSLEVERGGKILLQQEAVWSAD